MWGLLDLIHLLPIKELQRRPKTLKDIVAPQARNPVITTEGDGNFRPPNKTGRVAKRPLPSWEDIKKCFILCMHNKRADTSLHPTDDPYKFSSKLDVPYSQLTHGSFQIPTITHPGNPFLPPDPIGKGSKAFMTLTSPSNSTPPPHGHSGKKGGAPFRGLHNKCYTGVPSQPSPLGLTPHRTHCADIHLGHNPFLLTQWTPSQFPFPVNLTRTSPTSVCHPQDQSPTARPILFHTKILPYSQNVKAANSSFAPNREQ